MEAAMRKESKIGMKEGTVETMSQDKYKKYIKENGIHNVPVWRIVGFSGANMAVNLYMGLTMIMSFYLNGYVGMAVILASSFSTITRLWDGVTDPIVGFFVDRFKEKENFGKTRLCLVMGRSASFHKQFSHVQCDRQTSGRSIETGFLYIFYSDLLYRIHILKHLKPCGQCLPHQ